jgi:hypothetical protein
MFTGSNEVGARVQEAAARSAVKCVLELGVKSPQIVFEDADLDRALPIIVKAIVKMQDKRAPQAADCSFNEIYMTSLSAASLIHFVLRESPFTRRQTYRLSLTNGEVGEIWNTRMREL